MSAKNVSILGLLLLATTLVYANSLGNPFVDDDRAIIFGNFQPWRAWSLSDLFARTLFGTDPSEPVLQSAYFRPLTLLTFALNYSLAGERPQAYRAVNLALHLVVIILVALLLFRLAGRRAATFGALLFALHPVHVESVSYISSRGEPFYTSLALLCLLLWHKGNEARGSRRSLYLGAALGSFFVGLFAKESIIVVPALSAAMDLTWHRAEPWRMAIRKRLGWYSGFLLLFAVYLLIRVGLGFPLTMEGGRQLAWGSRSLLALKLFGLYLGPAVYPAHLSTFRVVPAPQSFFEWPVVLGTFLLLAMVMAAGLFWRVRREISFGILWYLISLLPVLNLTRLNAPLMEHWLYMPLIGLALAFVGIVLTLAERVGEVRAAALGFALIALLLSVRTVTRNAEWRDLLKVYLQDVSSYPGNSLPWARLADAMLRRGMPNEAVRAYQTSLTLNPRRGSTWLSLGIAQSLTGGSDEAEASFSRAISLRPQDPWFRYTLGVYLLKAGRNQAAIEALDASIALNPSPRAYHALGSAHLRLGEEEKADRALNRAMLLYPEGRGFHASVHVDLGKHYLSQGKRREAREELQVALRFDPDNPEALRLLSQDRNQE